jgi:hypothetical protein
MLVIADGPVSLYLLVPQYGYILPRFVSPDFGACSYQCFVSNCTPVSLHMLKCSCALTLSCFFIYCLFESIAQSDIMWSIVAEPTFAIYLCVQYFRCIVLRL